MKKLFFIFAILFFLSTFAYQKSFSQEFDRQRYENQRENPENRRFRGNRPMPPFRHRRPPALLEDERFLKNELNLSDKKILTIQKIFRQSRLKIVRNRENIKLLEISLNNLINKKNPKLKKIKELTLKISMLKSKIRFIWIKRQLDIEKLLSTGQREILREERMRFHRRRPMRPKRHRGPRRRFREFR